MGHTQLPHENAHSEHNEFHAVPKRKSGISEAVTFIIIVISVIFVMSVTFRVENITVTGNSHYTASEIINAIEIEEGDNLFFFDRFAAVTRVFAKLPYISEVQIARSLPNNVRITVTESSAVAYLKLGSELWTMDEKAKILGQAAEGEEGSLIPLVGFDAGTLFINETITTASGNDRPVSYLKAVLYQIQERGLAYQIGKIDFSDTNHVKLSYGEKYTVWLGDPSATEHKFAMVLSTVSQLKEGDIGIIDVEDGKTATFRPY